MTEDQDLQVVERLAEEFVERLRRGERPSINEYAERYPEQAELIRETFQALAIMEDLAPVSDDSFGEAGSSGRPLIGEARLNHIGDYRIIREVGRGGMGIVYEAEQVSLGRHVALKVLPKEFLDNARHRARFEREARAAAKLHHTNIVPVFGVGEHDGLGYYVMQFIQGLALDEVLEELRQMGAGRESSGASAQQGKARARRRDVSADEVARSLLDGTFKALTAVPNEPAVGLAHHGDETLSHMPLDAHDSRQLPPSVGQPAPVEPKRASPGPAALSGTFSLSGSSVTPGSGSGFGTKRRKQTYWQSVAQIGTQVADALDYAHGQGVLHRDIKPSNLLLDLRGTVWVTDFGLAKIDDDRGLTQTGDILGTLRYLAPETFEQPADARSEIYSLGLTLYELLALRPAFEPVRRQALIEQVLSARIEPLERVNPEIPRDLATIVHKAIDREPPHRYQTAGELADDLRRFIADEPIRARRISVIERLSRWSRRNKGLAASLAMVAALLLIINVTGPLYTWRMARLNNDLTASKNDLGRTVGQLEHERDKAERASAENLRLAETAQESLRKVEAAEQAARRAEEDSRLLLYTTDMQLAPVVWKEEGAEQLRALLARHEPTGKPTPSGEKEDLRGFEWYYYRHLVEDSGRVFRGHDATVIDCAVTPDGQLVTLDENSQIRRWNVETRTEVETARVDLRKGRNIRVSALSPDGQLAALVEGTLVRLLDTATGDDHFVSIGSANAPMRRLVFSADSQMLVIVDNSLGWFHTRSGLPAGPRLRSPWAQGQFEGVAFFEAVALSADGLTVAVAGHGPISVCRLNASAQHVTTQTMDAALGTIGTVAVSPDGELVAVGSKFAGRLAVLETLTGRRIVEDFSAHASPIAAIAFSQNGTELATADVRGTIKMWPDVRKFDATSQAKKTLKGHGSAVTNVHFLSERGRLVSSSVDKTARFWDAREAGASLRHLASTHCLCFSRDGELIAAAESNRIRLWDATTGRVVRELATGDSSSAASVAISPDNRLMAVGHRGGKVASFVSIWDIDSAKRFARLPGAVDLPDVPTAEEWGSAIAVAFSPDGRHLAACFGAPHYLSPQRFSCPIKVWEVTTRRLIRRLEGHVGMCTSLAFSADGAWLASGSQEGAAIIWSTKTWKSVRTLENPDVSNATGGRVVADVAFSPDGGTLAMASRGGNVVLWDASTGEIAATLKGHSDAVMAVAFSPDGRTLASGSLDQTVRLWNLSTRRELLQLDPSRLDVGKVRRLAFSPDATRLLASGERRSAYWSTSPPIWNNPRLAAEKLARLLESNVDFQLRVRMLSENLRLHEALAKMGSNDPRVSAALAATRANWHAAERRWAAAAEEFDRLKQIDDDDPGAWLRTPGLVHVARALFEQARFTEAAVLLLGGAKRRSADGAEVGLGLSVSTLDGTVKVTDVAPGSPAAHSAMRPGDTILRINGVELAGDAVPRAGELLTAEIGTRMELTVRHVTGEETEDLVLIGEAFFSDDRVHESLAELGDAIEARLATEPNNAGLLELHAAVAGLRSDAQSQLADYTAAIEALGARAPAAADEDLRRLYRRRGDVLALLKNWSGAVDDYARGAAENATDDEVSNEALAELEARLAKSIQTIVPTSEMDGQYWRFTTQTPAEGWNEAEFDDSNWHFSTAPFGTETPLVRTWWQSPEIWLRHDFQGAPTADMKALFLRLNVDDTAEVFLNGRRLAERSLWTQNQYLFLDVEAISPDLFMPGRNALAVHCRDFGGGAIIDVGLYATSETARGLHDALTAKAMTDPWAKFAAAHWLDDNQQGIDELVERRPQAAGPVGDLFAAAENWRRAVEIYSKGTSRVGLAIPSGQNGGLGTPPQGIDAGLFVKRAHAYEQLDEWHAAASDWARAAEGNPQGGDLLADFARRLSARGELLLAADHFERSRRLYEEDLRVDRENVVVAEALAKTLLESQQARGRWTVLEPLEMKSEGGTTLTLDRAGSILASGVNPHRDSYTLEVEAPGPITAFRLDALPHPSLPHKGSGRAISGNFILSDFAVTVDDTKVSLSRVTADYSQPGSPVEFAVDSDLSTGWAVYPHVAEAHSAFFSPAKPVGQAGGTRLKIRLLFHNEDWEQHGIGCCQLSVSNDPDAHDRAERLSAAKTINDPWMRLAAAYALHGQIDEATPFAERAIDEAITLTAKARLMAEIRGQDALLSALFKKRPNDPQVRLAWARQLVDHGTQHLAERPREVAERNLVDAREIFFRLRSEYPAPRWTVVKPIRLTSQGGATMSELRDGSILTGGPNPAKDVYEVEALVDDGGPLTAVRLEGLTHESLVAGKAGRSTNGNVMLTEFECEAAADADGKEWRPIKFVLAWADYDFLGYQVASAIDGLEGTGWLTAGTPTAIFVAERPFGDVGGVRLRIRLRHEYVWEQNQFGRFRLSVTGAPHVLQAALLQNADRDVRDALIALGKVNAQEGRVDDATAAFAKALTFAVGRTEKAEIIAGAASAPGMLDKLPSLAPDDVQLHAELARRYADEGHRELAAASRAKARDLYEHLLKEHPADSWPARDYAGELAELLLEGTGGALLDDGVRVLFDEQWRQLDDGRKNVRITADPWARLAAAYCIAGETQASDELLERHPEAVVATADLLAGEGHWERTLALYGKAIAARTTDPDLFYKRGWYFARLGRWRESADDLLRVRRLRPKETYPWMWAAPGMILSGNEEAYHEHCREMLEAFRGDDDASVADRVCKICLLRPGAAELSELPVQRLRAATTEQAWEGYRHWFTGTCALISYREGNPQQAIAWLEKVNDAGGQSGALALTVRAMAEHQLGRTEQSHQTLAQADALIPAELRTLGTDAYSGPLPIAEWKVWHDWLIPEILRREASALIDPPPDHDSDKRP